MLPPIHLTRALALAFAATTSQGTGTSTAHNAPVLRDIALQVENDNFHDATIYAVRPGYRQRLGFVSGLSKGSFTFRWPPGDVRLEIRLVAAGFYFTQVMDVVDGDQLELRILPNLHRMPSGTVF
jgi:hypothetical protein